MTQAKPTHSANPAELRRLKISPEVGWYLESRGIPLPDCPPKWKTPEPRTARGSLFDAARVDRVLRAFGLLRHTQGQWAGRPLKPDPWQVAYILAPVFGWVRKDPDSGTMVRIISSAYVDVPRKNGKTTTCGGIAIYLTAADGERGAQVLAAATTKAQAGFVFQPVKTMAQKSPALKNHVKPMQSKILHPASGSYFEVISSVADAQHGANVHGAVIDELHVHKDPELVETIETGTGSRTQPLIVIITTADDGRQGTIYARKRRYVEQLARRVLRDDTTYGVIWAADEKDDPFTEPTWRKANPGYGVSPTRAYMRRAAAKAQQSPADLSSFLRLHLGIRTKQETKFLELPVWDRNAGVVTEERLKGRVALGGLDLASTSDLCALCWDIPADDGSHDLVWRHWCPERAFDALVERTAREAEVWRREGWLQVTPGDVADYEFIRAQINQDRLWLDVRAIGYDRWNASSLVTELKDEDEAPMVQIGQGFQSMSAPLKAIKHLLLEGTARNPRYRHGGNPLVRWQIDNLAVRMDPAGNVKPDKDRSGDKIDGISAAVDAMAMVLSEEGPKRSVYEDRGFLMI